MQQKSFIDLAYENKKKKIRADAAVHDSQVMEKLLHGKERIVYGDKAYASQSRKEELPWSKLLKPLRKRYYRKVRKESGISATGR